MGWKIPWYTLTDGFDTDFGVDQWHGTNAFIRDGGSVFRTYFINNRGDEALSCALQRGYGRASSMSTRSENGGQVSRAHGPKSRLVSAMQAAPATGSTHRNVPDRPKCPKV